MIWCNCEFKIDHVEKKIDSLRSEFYNVIETLGKHIPEQPKKQSFQTVYQGIEPISTQLEWIRPHVELPKLGELVLVIITSSSPNIAPYPMLAYRGNTTQQWHSPYDVHGVVINSDKVLYWAYIDHPS